MGTARDFVVGSGSAPAMLCQCAIVSSRYKGVQLLTSMQLQRLELWSCVFAAHFHNLFSELLESGFWSGAGHVSSRVSRKSRQVWNRVDVKRSSVCSTAICSHTILCLNGE